MNYVSFQIVGLFITSNAHTHTGTHSCAYSIHVQLLSTNQTNTTANNNKNRWFFICCQLHYVDFRRALRTFAVSIENWIDSFYIDFDSVACRNSTDTDVLCSYIQLIAIVAGSETVRFRYGSFLSTLDSLNCLYMCIVCGVRFGDR